MDSINGREIASLDLHYCIEGDEAALYAGPVRERIPVSTAHTLAAMRLPSDAMSEILAAPRQDAEPSSPDFGDAMCMAPFVNLAVAIGGGSSPCCLFSEPIGDVRRQSIAEIWSSDAFAKLRTRFLAGKRDGRCGRCYKTEETGGLSLRNVFNSQFGERAPSLAAMQGDAPALPPPVSLDVRFSNLCNFSCRTCYHGASTKWFADAKKLGWEQAPEALIPTFNSSAEGIAAIVPLLDNVEKIYFAGGEPLLHEPHYAILAKLLGLGRTDVRLEYNTNFSELELARVDVLALWSRFTDVKVGVSIDGSGTRGELVRKGLDWDVFAENVRKLKTRCPHVAIRFDITVSIFNIAVLEDLVRDLMALGFTDPDVLRFNVLLEPTHYSIQILPKRMKRRIAGHLGLFSGLLAAAPVVAVSPSEYGTAKPQLQHVIDHMLARDRSSEIEAFRRVTSQLDGLRRERTLDTCPELAPLLAPSASAIALSWIRERIRPRLRKATA